MNYVLFILKINYKELSSTVWTLESFDNVLFSILMSVEVPDAPE